MKSFRQVLLPLFTFLQIIVSPSAVYAESIIDLSDLHSTVIERFPLIVAAEQERFEAEGEKRAALGAFDVTWKNKATVSPLGYYDNERFDSIFEKPTEVWGMNVYGGYRRGAGDFPIYYGEQVTTDGGEFRAGVQLPLLRDRDIDTRRAGLASADIGLTMADQSITLQKIETIKRATLTYWKWVAAGKRIEIVSSLLNTARERDEGLRERVLQGDVAEFERKDNLRSLLEREAQLIRAERAYQEAAIELSLYYRDDLGVPVLPTKNQIPKIIPPPALAEAFLGDELFKRALSQRPEVKILKFEQEQNEIDNKVAKNDLGTRLNMLMEVSKDVGGSDRTREQAELETGVVLEIPLQRREAEGRIEKTNAIRSRIENRMKFFTDRIVADVKDAISALENARGQIEIVRRELQYAKELEQGERYRFKAGDSTILIVNLREQATADSAIREISALAEYHSAEAKLKAALGEF